MEQLEQITSVGDKFEISKFTNRRSELWCIAIELIKKGRCLVMVGLTERWFLIELVICIMLFTGRVECRNTCCNNVCYFVVNTVYICYKEDKN